MIYLNKENSVGIESETVIESNIFQLSDLKNLPTFESVDFMRVKIQKSYLKELLKIIDNEDLEFSFSVGMPIIIKSESKTGMIAPKIE